METEVRAAPAEAAPRTPIRLRDIDDEDLFTPEQVGVILGGPSKPVTVQTLARWRHENVGPKAIKIEGFVRYTGRAIKEYLAALMENSAAAE